MEEKEKYKWSQDVIIECAYEDYDYIVDTENNIIFDDDNYFKLVDLLNQQDKRIKELETCLDEEIESNVNLYNLQLKTEQKNQQLKQQLTITEKALELACKEITELESPLNRFCWQPKDEVVEHFKTKAKELKSE